MVQVFISIFFVDQVISLPKCDSGTSSDFNGDFGASLGRYSGHLQRTGLASFANPPSLQEMHDEIQITCNSWRPYMLRFVHVVIF